MSDLQQSVLAVARREAMDRDGSVVWEGHPHVDAYLARGAVIRNRARRDARLLAFRRMRMVSGALATASAAGWLLFGSLTSLPLAGIVLGLVLTCIATWLVGIAEFAVFRGHIRGDLMAFDAYAASDRALYVASYHAQGYAEVIRHEFEAIEKVGLKMRDGGSRDVDVAVGGKVVRLHALPNAREATDAIVALGTRHSRVMRPIRMEGRPDE